jgi:Metallo-beta-lactamase superfamily
MLRHVPSYYTVHKALLAQWKRFVARQIVPSTPAWAKQCKASFPEILPPVRKLQHLSADYLAPGGSDDFISIELPLSTGVFLCVKKATVIAHALDAEIIESGVHQRPMTPAPDFLNRILFQLFVKDLLPVPPVKVDRCVVDGETFHELDGLQVIHTPGHSAGQIAFFWPQDRGVLFVGDAAANTLGLRLSISYEDLQLGKKTLARLAKLPFSKACFGHGQILSSGAAGKFIRRWGAA